MAAQARSLSSLPYYWKRLGVLELLRFDPQNVRRPLQIWDRVEGALVERQVTGSSAPSLLLDLHWVVAPAEGIALALRISREGILIPTRKEAVAAAQRAHDLQQQATRAAEQATRAAEARIRELEEQLKRR